MLKKFSKKLITFIFLTIQLSGMLFLVLVMREVQAAGVSGSRTEDSTPYWGNPFDKLQIKIPGMQRFSEVAPCPDDPEKMCVKWISEYIAGLYSYAIGIVGILAAVILMIAGLIWLTAGGNQTRIGTAKSYIGASLTGLVIALSSYLILYQINPELVKLRSIKIASVKKPPETAAISSKCSWQKTGAFNGCDSLGLRNTTGEEECSDSPPTITALDSNEEILDPNYECCCLKLAEGGTCQETQSGFCVVNELYKGCFGTNAAKASQICFAESGGISSKESLTDKCKTGEPFSVGLFQINLTVHKVNGLDCPNAFSGKDYDCTVTNSTLYGLCVAAAKDPNINISEACKISGNGNSWSQWSAAKTCNL